MLRHLSFEEFTILAGRSHRVAVFRQLIADQITPVGIYQSLCVGKPEAVLLDSAQRGGVNNRYSFIGLDPSLSIEATGSAITVRRNGIATQSQGDPLQALRTLAQSHRAAASDSLPSQVGGAIGYCSYDLVRQYERLPDPYATEDTVPDLRFGFYDSVIAFDHLNQVVTLVHIQEVGECLKDSYSCANRVIDDLEEAMRRPPSFVSSREKGALSPVVSDVSDELYIEAVKRAKEYIVAGDIFQVVLSRTFHVPCPVGPFDVFRALRMVSPTSYLFFLQYPDFALAGASPERHLSLRDGVLETNPIAGTRPLAPGAEEELLADPKERAEHMMLVDLARNDLGSVSAPGTVSVQELAAVQKLSHVMHLTSRVQGQLADGLDALHALKATLPAGTVSGAPKVRAMQIIDELETTRRGPYGGAICYLDNRGNFDSCLTIRSALIRDGIASVRTGAGIVYDSDPQREADETRHKAASVLKALQFAVENMSC